METETIKSIEEWTADTFGYPFSQQVFLKLVEEVGELSIALQHSDHKKAAVEAADCFIVLCHLSRCLMMDFEKVVAEKMKINRERKWEKTESGTFHHV